VGEPEAAGNTGAEGAGPRVGRLWREKGEGEVILTGFKIQLSPLGYEGKPRIAQDKAGEVDR